MLAHKEGGSQELSKSWVGFNDHCRPRPVYEPRHVLRRGRNLNHEDQGKDGFGLAG